MDSEYDLEELSHSLQKCEPFSSSRIHPSLNSIAHDISSSEILFGRRDDIGNDKVRLDDRVGIKFHDKKCSSPPRRSARATNLNQSNISIKAAKGCGKQVVKNGLLDSIAKMERKSRSLSCRPARSSVWGSIGISKYFDKKTSGVINKVSKKSQHGRVAQESGKAKSEPNGNSSTSLGRIRIKVKIGNEIDQMCVTNMVSVTENVPIYEAENVTGTHKINFNGYNSSEEFSDTLPNKELKSFKTGKKLDGLMADNNQGISFPVDVEGPGVSIDNKYMDLGTSPDSEVINVIPEAQINEKERKDFSNLPSTRRKKGKKSDNLLSAQTMNDQHILGRLGILEKAGVAEECGQEEKLIAGFCLTSSEKLFSNKSSSEGSAGELLPLSIAGETENESLCTKNKGKKHVKISKSKKGSKVGPDLSESPKSQRGHAGRQKGKVTKSTSKKKGKEEEKDKDKGASGEFARTIQDYHEAGFNFLVGRAKSEDERTIQEEIEVEQEIIKPNTNVDVTHTDQNLPPRNAWVLCDECSKWRRIPAVLADSIDETNSRWTCKENVDKDFADCSILQEKSNSEINAELEISDAEDGQNDGFRLKGAQPHLLEGNERSSWKLIKSNKFMHRGRKSQTIDEIMVCHCKTPSNGKLGCGDGCLNRMLNIECVRGTCPCGKSCSNQQFQKRKYAKLKWFRCGKKGYGLQLLEDISEGQFLIEYIGEVLDMQAYEARQRDYASLGHKHFYFMTLNGSEVIDACAKGNLGRFINHSCDPNCRTEKWMVNGEVCVGLFALKNLKKGEEVTFDYNYVRVFGAAAKKCVCGSSHCRGYIGGDPRNSEVIVQGDSDDEFPEPVMVYDDGEPDDNLKRLVSTTSDLDDPTASCIDMEKVLTCEDKLEIGSTVEKLEYTKELHLGDVLINEVTKANESANNFHQLESEKLQISFEVMEKSADVNSPIQLVDKKILVSDLSDTKKKQKSEKFVKICAPKSKTAMKISNLSSSVKKGKSTNTNSATSNKPENMVYRSPGLSNKSKKIIESSVTARSEVEEKLNEVLDVEGGISKRQDAAQGYLKLLFLTAASGEANQSNRDLSMILGAIWKTKSRSVLVDVISKNGLQMLHNILKRCRRDFNKIPILRKLLKVLEFLASKEILTVELINKDPSHAGVESFRESILSLSEHDDKQVHQIARNFRDRWIPRSLRKNNDFHRGFNGNRHPSHNHWRERNSQTSDTANDKNQSSPANVPVAIDTIMNETCSSSSGTQTRKRKSRWDQPAESNKELKIQLDIHNINARVNDDCLDKRADEGEHVDEDVPPGFAPPCNASSLPIVNGFPCKVEIGQPQGKFMNRSSVSYGIPMPIVQQLGYPKTDNLEDWFIAPGVPFQPYPPLPSYSRNRYDEMRDCRGNNCQPGHNPPSTSAVNPSNVEIQGTNNCHGLQKASSPHGMGRFFRQQKWNNSRLPPPWIRKQNGRGFSGHSSRNRTWDNRNGEEGGYMETYPNSFTQNPQREGYH